MAQPGLVESLQDLERYRQELQQVEEALVQQPEEETLINLRNDLRDIIKITQELCSSTNLDTSSEALADAQNSGGRGALHVVPASTEAQALVGRTCEALYDGKWYNSIILSVRKSSQGVDKCLVEYIGCNGFRQEFRIQDVSLLQPPHPAQCHPGTTVQAVWHEDGLWYDALIEEQTEEGYRINYLIQSGGALDVKFDQVRLKKSAAGPSSNAQQAGKRKIAEIVTPAGWRIPENLTIKATDSEQSRKIKKNKIRAIKSKQRQEAIDQAAEEKKSGWQKFQKKTSIKSSTIGIKMNRESIFKSPESLDGKVGVTGSGQGMTQSVQRIRIHNHDDDEEDED
eukprot:GHVL01024272.1.p1 GENE.GHVL01024272.1~~GHVL01024272.1.p1  ORF type:complete len:340 (+),score=74.37 GHVL01024272.1:65-1084(+)